MIISIKCECGAILTVDGSSEVDSKEMSCCWCSENFPTGTRQRMNDMFSITKNLADDLKQNRCQLISIEENGQNNDEQNKTQN